MRLQLSRALCSPSKFGRASQINYCTAPSSLVFKQRLLSTTPRIMSAKDTAGADKKEGITGWASKDGSFKRQTSSFRDVIEPGGKFEPEKGEHG